MDTAPANYQRHKTDRGNPMAKKLDNNEIVTFEEMLLANSAQVDTAVQLLIEMGFFTKEEFFDKLKQVYAEYQINESDQK